MSEPMAQLTADSLREEELRGHYLAAMRGRFKAEVNRMTGGAMARHLGGRPDAELLAFPLSYAYAFAWLRRNVHDAYRADVLAAFRKSGRGFLMDLLQRADDAEGFLHAYIDYLLHAPQAASLVQRDQLDLLLARHGGDGAALVREMLSALAELDLFPQSYAEGYRDLGRHERERYRGMLDAADLERLALVDALPEPAYAPAPFPKLGVIPAMGCPQTCRHCMFIWRPPMRSTPDPRPLYELVDGLTESVLFTGGDLTRHLDTFNRAIAEMPRVRTFAILLNGEFAEDMRVTGETLEAMAQAVAGRPREWPEARVLLQISFDEFHQEVLAEADGRLRERIPVAKVANIVECATRHRSVQLCLVHKQTALNFSLDVLRKGVFGRLAAELGRRGHQVQVLATGPSPRLKRHPQQAGQMGQVLKDASFVLAGRPERPILLTSSTIDAYGRAALLDPGEAVQERDLLHQVLSDGPPEGEVFDTDLMFWFNGWATLFSAVHVCLGDIYRDGAERVLARHRKDPLTAALRRFDRRLLDYYAELRPDLEARVEAATGPQHLFHVLTEEPELRLHMTRRLLA